MKNITESEIRKLYEDDLLDDKQIAEVFGVSPSTIFTLRKRYSVAGISPRRREYLADLPPALTARQNEIVVGTLLGDGCLKSSGKMAYLSLAHSVSQKEYIDWKVQELAVFFRSPAEPYERNGYTTYYATSRATEQFAQLRNLIYLPKKTVSREWLSQITPLSLAVWYMDDGNYSFKNISTSTCSIATHSFSLNEQLLLQEMLKSRFGVNVIVATTELAQHFLEITPESMGAFFTLISPHVIPSMRRKIDVEEAKRFWQDRIKADVDKDELLRLYSSEKLTQNQVAERIGVHKQTVKKYLSIMGIEARGNVEAQLGGKNARTIHNKLNGRFQKMACKLSNDEMKVADGLFLQMRSSGFPYPEKAEDAFYFSILERMMTKNDDECLSKYPQIGMKICRDFCPQIFSMKTHGSISPLEIFMDDQKLMDCIMRTIFYAKKQTVAAVRSGLKTYRNNRCVSVFPPYWAKHILTREFEGRNDLRVLDFSAGFGGRLIGAFTSQLVSSYLGYDPLKENADSLRSITKLLQDYAKSFHHLFPSVRIGQSGWENVDLGNEEVDCVITSPPYFNKEEYSGENTQCYVKHADYQEWIKEWFSPALAKAWHHLTVGGKMILFVADYGKVNVGQQAKRILKDLSGKDPKQILYPIPSVEYLRANAPRRNESCLMCQRTS